MTSFELNRLSKEVGSLSRTPNSAKYHITTCQPKINRIKTSLGWIEIIGMLKKVMERDIDIQKSQILKAKLKEATGDIIVKIGDNASIKQEYEMASKLSRLKGFVKFICFFECEDDFREHFGQTSRTTICKGEGTSMKVILMPYFKLGSMAQFSWNASNLHLLKSCIKHACLSIIIAFNEKNIIHGDFHPANVVLKDTKQSVIEYHSLNLKIPTNKIRTWIMDFENTREYQSDQSNDAYRALGDFYYDLQKFFMMLASFVPIDRNRMASITKTINAFNIDMKRIGPIEAAQLCALIDEYIQL